MQLNASHVDAQEGPPFARQPQKGGPGSSPCWKLHHSWGGSDAGSGSTKLALNRKGARAPSPGSSDGGVGCVVGIQSLVPKWVWTRSQV